MLKKVVVIGPESTGKSTLCQELAQEFHTYWVPEYARSYMKEKSAQYTYEDLLTIAKGQLELEDTISHQCINENKEYVFIDTDMYVMKVWCEFVFGKCHSWILDRIADRQYDHYFLCNTDLPWVKDELREYPDLQTRLQLFHIYHDLLVQQETPWTIISGNEAQRLNTALQALKG
jgi:NadR type nicotinamide-nucleotide adenylyltransferase